jgi:hypothetical protein
LAGGKAQTGTGPNPGRPGSALGPILARRENIRLECLGMMYARLWMFATVYQ